MQPGRGLLKVVMQMSDASQPPGWYPAQGDPPGTVRWWDGGKWVGGPQQQGAQQQAGYVAPGAGSLANGRELSDPWLRIAAKVIDTIVATLITLPFGAAAIVSAFRSGADGTDLEVNIGIAIIGSIVGAAYYTLMNTYLSATVGKLLLGIRIVKRDGTEPLGIPDGPKRSLMHIIGIIGAIPILGILVSIVTTIVALVSLVFLFTDPEHRTVMDRFADTYVVKK
jgi:uncharacterized RDD family membrane protein YckC